MKLPWVPKFTDSVLAAFGNVDLNTFQPYGWLHFEPLFAKEFVAKVDELVQTARKMDVSLRELAKLWPTTSSLRFAVCYLILQSKCARIPQEKRIELAQFFFDMLQARAVDDVYGFTSNICQTSDEIDAVLKKITFNHSSPETAKFLGKLYNTLYNLCAGRYIDFYLDYCAENEGPYDVSHLYGKGHTLVIKKFVNIQTEAWPEVPVPHSDVVLYCVYKDVKFTCDMISVHSLYEGDVINGLVDYAVVVDGETVNDVDQLKVLLNQLSLLSVEQWQQLKSLSEYEQKVKGLYSKHYGMKKLFDHVGMDWKPTEQMREAVKAPLKDSVYWNIPEDTMDADVYWRKIHDPEEEFYPGDSLPLRKVYQ